MHDNSIAVVPLQKLGLNPWQVAGVHHLAERGSPIVADAYVEYEVSDRIEKAIAKTGAIYFEDCLRGDDIMIERIIGLGLSPYQSLIYIFARMAVADRPYRRVGQRVEIGDKFAAFKPLGEIFYAHTK